jgi:hypothetical protein
VALTGEKTIICEVLIKEPMGFQMAFIH